VSRPAQPWDRRWWNRSNMQGLPPAVRRMLMLNGTKGPERKWRGPGYGHVLPDAFHHMAFRRTVAMLGALLQAESPFFFAAGLSGTHTPLVPPLSFVRKYDAASVVLPASHAAHGPALARKDGFQTYPQLTPTQQREYIATYLGAASYVDAQVGVLVDMVDRKKAERPTAVIAHSDHGFHLGEHGRWSKYTLYEEVVHVPLVMRIPGAKRGARVSKLVELVDVLPTLLSLWGMPEGQWPPLDGRNLLPLAGLAGLDRATDGKSWTRGADLGVGSAGAGSGGTPGGREFVRSAMRHPMIIRGSWVCGEQHYVRTRTHAMINYLFQGSVVNTSLFDLLADPLEQSNLLAAGQSAPPSLLREWAGLVAHELESWPRHEVRARDAAGRAAGEHCQESTSTRRQRRHRRRLLKAM